MALVLPHAPPIKALTALPKGASASPHAAIKAPSPAPVKFQALLDHAAAAKKPESGAAKAAEVLTAEKAAADKLKPKAKATEAPAVSEKPKEAKKAEPKEPKADGDAGAAALAAQPRVEAPKAVKAPEADTAADKAKAPVRTDKKASDVPAPVTAAAAEVARSQAQQHQPRTERSDDKPKVFVVDRRSEKDKERVKSAAEAAAAQPVNAAVEVQTQAKPIDGKTNPNEVQVSFQTVAGKNSDGFELKSQASAPSPRDAVSFQQYLVDKGYGQLVDQARIVLKDNNAGEIRMTLYPESLGKVKVSLNLDDNSLAGQIFVENQTVKDVFQSNMDGLLQAFQDGGWNNVSVQVSVGGESGAGTQNGQPQPAPQARDYGRQVTQTLGTASGSDRIGTWSDRQINLTA
jgi:flagellar hook-length control protein FliK